MKTNREPPRKLATIRGIVVPAGWTVDGSSSEVLIIDDDDEEYLVHSLNKELNLGRYIDSVVEVTGLAYDRDGHKTIALKRIKMLESQNEYDEIGDIDESGRFDEEFLEDEEYISEFSRSIKSTR
jgi:hypothetical protein